MRRGWRSAGLLAVAVGLLAGCGGPEVETDAPAVAQAARVEGPAGKQGALAPGETVWLRRLDSFDTRIGGLVQDRYGDLVVVLAYSHWLDLGSGPVGQGSAAEGIALLKFAPDGVLRWMRTFPHLAYGTSGRRPGIPRVAVDSNGNIVLAGYLNAPADFGTGPLPWGPYLARFDRSGNTLWARHFANHSGNMLFEVRRVLTDASGHIIMGGTYGGIVNFGGGYVASNRFSEPYTPPSAFIAHYTSKGRLKSLSVDGQSSPNHTRLDDLALDASGDLFIATSISGVPDRIERRAPDGTTRWVRRVEPAPNARIFFTVQQLVPFGDALALVGTCEGAFRFGGETHVIPQMDRWPYWLYTAGCVLAYGKDGEERWVRPTVGVTATGATADGSGGLVIAGTYVDGQDLGRGPVAGVPPEQYAYNQNPYVLRLDGVSGATRWARGFAVTPLSPDTTDVNLRELLLTKTGALMVAGGFDGEVDLGTGIMSSGHKSDGVLFQLVP